MEILNTVETNLKLEKMIYSDKTKVLFLISPFIKFNSKMKSILEKKTKEKVLVTIIGKNFDNIDFKWIKENHIKLMQLESLHAKIYTNVFEIILSSMNLYGYSQNNNFEISTYFNHEKDSKHYKEIFDKIEEIMESAKIIIDKKGYCIRTGQEIELNISRPYSYNAFKEWDKNPDNKENYCHFSGEKTYGKTSFKNPILRR